MLVFVAHGIVRDHSFKHTVSDQGLESEDMIGVCDAESKPKTDAKKADTLEADQVIEEK